MNTQIINVSSALQAKERDIKLSLPSHVKLETFMQVANTAAMLNPALQECTVSSLSTAFISCAKDGLLPDGRAAAIIIYNKKQGNEWVKVAQYQPMIDGILQRLRQSGEVPYISAKVVYKDDEFDYWMDTTGENLTYRPNFKANRNDDDILAVFAMAKLKTGHTIIEVMTKREVDNIMFSSKSAVDNKGNLKPDSVWAKFYARMAIKTVLHRISKRLPNSSEVLDMLEREIDIKTINNDKGLNTPSNNQSPPPSASSPISDEQIQELKDMIAKSKSNESQMFKFISSNSNFLIDDYYQLNQEHYGMLMKVMENKCKKAA